MELGLYVQHMKACERSLIAARVQQGSFGEATAQSSAAERGKLSDVSIGS